MNEEEKKAIEDLKRLRKGIEILNLITKEKDEVDIKAIDIVLNLVNKQQKEIEELIKINTPLSWEMKDKDGNVIVSLKKPDYYISKDKIREMIKHYNDELEHIKNGEEFENEKPMYYWGKVALEDLLEEN